jgi:hypothetical protein
MFESDFVLRRPGTLSATEASRDGDAACDLTASLYSEAVIASLYSFAVIAL